MCAFTSLSEKGVAKPRRAPRVQWPRPTDFGAKTSFGHVKRMCVEPHQRRHLLLECHANGKCVGVRAGPRTAGGPQSAVVREHQKQARRGRATSSQTRRPSPILLRSGSSIQSRAPAPAPTPGGARGLRGDRDLTFAARPAAQRNVRAGYATCARGTQRACIDQRGHKLQCLQQVTGHREGILQVT